MKPKIYHQSKLKLVGFILLNMYIFFILQSNYFNDEKLAANNSDIEMMAHAETSETIHILLSCDCNDEGYRYLLFTLINSIIVHEEAKHIDRLYFHIFVFENKSLIHNELNKYFHQYSQTIQFDIKSMIDDSYNECIDFYNIARKYVNSSKRRLLNPMNFARFCLPSIFNTISIGIYLDVDIIVLDSISKMYAEYKQNNNKEYKILSAYNVNTNKYLKFINDTNNINIVNNYLHHFAQHFTNINNSNFNEIKYLFNPAIMIFDLNIWRKYNFQQQTLELLELFQDYELFMDGPPWKYVARPIINLLYILNKINIGNLSANWHIFCVQNLINCDFNSNINDNKINITSISAKNKIIHWQGCFPFYPQLHLYSIWSQYAPNELLKTYKYYNYMINESYQYGENEWIRFKCMAESEWFHYRLGDMLYQKYAREEIYGYKYHAKEFPNSIAVQYMEQINNTDDSAATRTQTLINVINQYNIENKNVPIPENKTLVVHLRLGDVLEDPHAYSVRKQWAHIYHANVLHYFQYILPQIKLLNLSKVTILTGFYARGNHTISTNYIIKVKDWFINNNFEINFRINGNPDHDFNYLCNSKYLIKSEGKYSRGAADVVKQNGGKVWHPSDRDWLKWLVNNTNDTNQMNEVRQYINPE